MSLSPGSPGPDAYRWKPSDAEDPINQKDPNCHLGSVKGLRCNCRRCAGLYFWE
jgi:hypothetical protein